MKSWIRLVFLVGGVGAFLAAFAWLLTTHGPLAPVDVRVGRVVRTDLQPVVFGIGTVEARRTYAVGPIAPGRLLRVLVDQGEAVKAGQLLAEMDPVDMDRRVQAAQSTGARSRQSVQVANAQVAEAASRAKLAAANRSRDSRLFEQGVISRQMLDVSAAEAERAAAALAASRASARVVAVDIDRVDAEAQGLGSLRDSLRIVSPVDGVVTAREIEPGTTVVAGQPVLRLVAPDSLWVRARIDQSRAKDVRVGQVASIVLRSAPNTPLVGRVARIELQGDAVTEERIVTVSFNAPPDGLYLGELAEVTLHLPAVMGVLAIPSATVTTADGKVGVWQVVNGRTRFQAVALGNQGQPGLAQVTSGLAEGDPVVVHSSALLRPDMRVRPQATVRP
jgi:HlyD family secretion protein